VIVEVVEAGGWWLCRLNARECWACNEQVVIECSVHTVAHMSMLLSACCCTCFSDTVVYNVFCSMQNILFQKYLSAIKIFHKIENIAVSKSL
jgi:hypothetical protein